MGRSSSGPTSARSSGFFLNLLSNAIKFSHDGGAVHIRVSAAAADAVVIEVEDHGIGMDAGGRGARIAALWPGEAGDNRTYGGTGLGLPITKGLVEAHGGNLTILSRPGEGTTIRLILPVQPAGLLGIPASGPVPPGPVAARSGSAGPTSRTSFCPREGAHPDNAVR